MICAQSASRAISVALVPADCGTSTPPRPGCSSMLWIAVPSGIFDSGRQLPTVGGASAPLSTCVARLQAVRGQDVALLAVDVVQQGDAGRAVRIVLDRIDLGRNAVLVAAEVDQPVRPLVAAAADAGR